MCTLCGGDVEHQATRVIEEFGDEILVVEGVPAGVCVCCGEKEFAPDTIRRLERIRQERGRITARRAVPVAEYDEPLYDEMRDDLGEREMSDDEAVAFVRQVRRERRRRQ